MITIIILITLGIIAIWIWIKWRLWVKIVVTILLSILVIALSLIAIAQYLYNDQKIRPVQIVGKAMLPTYKDGMYLLTQVIDDKSLIERGSVLVFDHPNKPIQYIKRVIGLPNEKILIKNGDIYIDNKKLDENLYLYPDMKTIGGSIIQDNKEFVIPTNHYVLMGDNREFSNDSRDIGAIPGEKIISKVGNCYRFCE